LGSLGEAGIVNAGLLQGELGILSTLSHLEEAVNVLATTSTLSLFGSEPARSAARSQEPSASSATARVAGHLKAVIEPVVAAFVRDQSLRSLNVLF